MKLKISLFVSLFVLLSFVFIQFVSADGMIHIFDRDIYRWNLVSEDQQFALINYENGFQKMILTVDVSEARGERAVWIFPVPAKPDKIAMDITVRGFPGLYGYDVKRRVGETISGAFLAVRLSQIYPLFIIYFFYPAVRAPFSYFDSKEKGLREEVTIHEHIEKMGLTSELISTKESDPLYNYLKSKDLELPPESKKILDEYIGKEYSFVISWISDVEKFKQELAGVSILITFPTEKIYFPLKPTSVYGDAKIPIVIYVIGHVTPEIYPKIREETQVNYFIQGNYIVSPEFSSFFGETTTIQNLKYTKIKIDTPSKYLIEDLWIEDSAPKDIIVADFINKYVLLWGIILFILSSCLASLFSGMIVFGEEVSKKKFLLFGLWNLLTLVGFAVASIFLRTRKGVVEKILFIFLFTIFFLMITFGFQLILQSLLSPFLSIKF